MFASMKGRAEHVRLLLKPGADMSPKCKEGLTALDYATKHGNKETIQALKWLFFIHPSATCLFIYLFIPLFKSPE
jgi:hypothetical protein